MNSQSSELNRQTIWLESLKSSFLNCGLGVGVKSISKGGTEEQGRNVGPILSLRLVP
jgi:hypothetical protein